MRAAALSERRCNRISEGVGLGSLAPLFTRARLRGARSCYLLADDSLRGRIKGGTLSGGLLLIAAARGCDWLDDYCQLSCVECMYERVAV